MSSLYNKIKNSGMLVVRRGRGGGCDACLSKIIIVLYKRIVNTFIGSFPILPI